MEVKETFAHYAKKAADALAVPWQWVYAQWAHETGDFTSYLAKTQNNLAGLTSVRGGFRYYNNLDEFADSYVNDFLVRMPKATSAKTVEDFTAGLKAHGYYEDTLANYTVGVKRFLPEGGEGENPSPSPIIQGGVISSVDVPWYERILTDLKYKLRGLVPPQPTLKQETEAREYIQDKATEQGIEVGKDFNQRTKDLRGYVDSLEADGLLKKGLIAVSGLVVAVLGFVLVRNQRGSENS